jgi:hypothetical protein
MQLSLILPVQSLGSESSYALESRSENGIVRWIIVPELELRNVKMQAFLADAMESVDDATLDGGSEPRRMRSGDTFTNFRDEANRLKHNRLM